MKKLNRSILIVALVLISGYVFIAGCTHKNEVVPTAASGGSIAIARGSHVHKAGIIAGDTSQWKFDQVHSNVTWSTSYLGVGAQLTGRFNQFGMANVAQTQMLNYNTAAQPLPDTAWAFNEKDPTKIHFSGYVQMNTSNTGQPGRDAGCYIGSVGTTAIVAGVQNLTQSNIAQIKTVSVAFDPLTAGYIANISFTWKGNLAAPLTQNLVGKLSYIPSASVGGLYNEFGLHLEFQFNCRDYGVTSTNIADKISIEVNANFNNK